MTNQETNNNPPTKTQGNRVSLVFKHPEILHTFNNHIKRKYGEIKHNRIRVIEELLQAFNETQEIEYKKPLYYQENRKLKQENSRLITENTNYKKQVQTLQTLTGKLKNYESLHEDNVRLTEELRNSKNTIDNLTQKLDKEEKNNSKFNELTETLRTETSNRVLQLTQIIQDKETEIQTLQEQNKNYNRLLEENIRLHETQKNYKNNIDDLKKKLQEHKNTLHLQERTHEEEIKELYSTYETLNIEHTETLTNYEGLNEDNIRLTEELRNSKNTIDNLTKKLNILETEKKEHLKELHTVSTEHEQRLNNIITTHDSTINDLVSKYESKLQSKDSEISELNKLVSGYALNYSNYRVGVESMGLLDRVFKRFPKPNDKFKKLK